MWSGHHWLWIRETGRLWQVGSTQIVFRSHFERVEENGWIVIGSIFINSRGCRGDGMPGAMGHSRGN